MSAKRITVKAQGDCNESAEGSEIWIAGVLADDIWYPAEEVFDHFWLRKWRMLGWNSYTDGLPDELRGNLNPGLWYTYLVFEKNRWRGKCYVDFSGKSIWADCYGETDGGFLYVGL